MWAGCASTPCRVCGGGGLSAKKDRNQHKDHEQDNERNRRIPVHKGRLSRSDRRCNTILELDDGDKAAPVEAQPRRCIRGGEGVNSLRLRQTVSQTWPSLCRVGAFSCARRQHSLFGELVELLDFFQ